jgi:hypothetical protein
MDPYAIASLSISIASTLTGIVSLVLKKIHQKNKQHKKVTTKIIEGDIVKKHSHHNKEKLKSKDKENKDEVKVTDDSENVTKTHAKHKHKHKHKHEDHTDEKLKVIASILSLDTKGDSSINLDPQAKLKAVASILNLGISNELNASLDESMVTQIKFKHTEISEETTTENVGKNKELSKTAIADGDSNDTSNLYTFALTGEGPNEAHDSV